MKTCDTKPLSRILSPENIHCVTSLSSIVQELFQKRTAATVAIRSPATRPVCSRVVPATAARSYKETKSQHDTKTRRPRALCVARHMNCEVLPAYHPCDTLLPLPRGETCASARSISAGHPTIRENPACHGTTSCFYRDGQMLTSSHNHLVLCQISFNSAQPMKRWVFNVFHMPRC